LESVDDDEERVDKGKVREKGKGFARVVIKLLLKQFVGLLLDSDENGIGKIEH